MTDEINVVDSEKQLREEYKACVKLFTGFSKYELINRRQEKRFGGGKIITEVFDLPKSMIDDLNADPRIIKMGFGIKPAELSKIVVTSHRDKKGNWVKLIIFYQAVGNRHEWRLPAEV